MTVVSLAAEKWLNLCAHAEHAARLTEPHIGDDLANAAGRLTTVTPPYKGVGEYALIMSFRWDCTAFGHADALNRAQLADPLAAKARMVRMILSPTPSEPPASAVALPLPEAEPRWARRADIGG